MEQNFELYVMLIKVPPDVNIIEMPRSLLWLDENQILTVVPKQPAGKQPTIEEIRSEMDELRRVLGYRKVCIIMEASSRSESPPKEERDFIAREISSITKAMAIVTSSPLSRMAANLFFSFKPPGYPYKIFSNETEARKWIKQFV
jgi:hypothetical protein